MSVDAARNRLPAWDPEPALDQLRTARDRAATLVFGDEIGTLLFMGALLFFALYWRIGIFITDNWTIANTLVAVADGHLALTEQVYGPPGVVTPGMHFVDGQAYGRNYGQVVLALPFLWVVEAVMLVADLKVAIAGAWSLLLVGFAGRVGAVVGDRERFVWLGVGGALVAFAVNTAYAVPLEPHLRYLVALQLSTMVFAALIGVVLYRLVSAIHDRRTGVFVGAATVLATPVGFWASLPKRHVLIALLAIVTIAAFYKSRAVESDDVALWARGLAYAAVGLAAWVHAAEALTLFIVLVPIDLATARSNSPRRLAFVGGVFLVSLLPFIVTNQLIAGNPLIPPRFIGQAPPAPPPTPTATPTPEPTPTATPGEGTPVTAGETPGGAITPSAQSGGEGTPAAGTGAPGGGGFSLEPIVGLAAGALDRTRYFVTTMTAFVTAALAEWSGYVSRGLDETAIDPSRIYHTYVRSDHKTTRASATDLSLLETTPVFGVVGAVLVLLVAKVRSLARTATWRRSSVRQTDALTVAYIIGLALFNLDRLPLQAMWTVRYLLPLVPIGMYGVGRLAPVREILGEQPQLLAYSYAGLVLIGGQVLLVYLVAFAPTRDEVMQIHGVIGVVAAAVVFVWVVGFVLNVYDDRRVGAVVLAIPLAIGTLFVLFTGLEYFVVGNFGFDISGIVSEMIPLF